MEKLAVHALLGVTLSPISANDNVAFTEIYVSIGWKSCEA